jgi:hypothetical protein
VTPSPLSQLPVAESSHGTSQRSTVCGPVPGNDTTMRIEDDVVHTARYILTIDPYPNTAQHPSADSSLRKIPSSDSLPQGANPTDGLCSRSLFKTMLNDYVRHLYPAVPVVHRPSFRRDVRRNRDVYDNDFLGLTFAICAVLIATMPSKFQEYRSGPTPLRFQTRTEMVNCCREMVLNLQGPAYYDEISLQKWAVPYLLAIAYFQVGQHNRGRMLEVESMQLARLLELHDISSHTGLNCIEIQLRKRAFWLMFYTYVQVPQRQCNAYADFYAKVTLKSPAYQRKK